jgi:flagellar hook-associated protein 3 FlgL
MISGLDASNDRFLAALKAIEARAELAQRQISSGKKLETPSDQPDQVIELLLARSQLGQTQQITTNLGRAKAEVDTGEQALEDAVSVLQNVNTLGVQGATSTQTPAQRQTIASNVEAALEHLVEDADTTVEGRHIFSGDNYSAAPYSVDLTQAHGVTAYAGGAATREMLHPSGTRFAISKSADEIFDSSASGASVFAAVNALRLALQNGPTVAEGDPAYNAQYSAQTDAIHAALTQISSAQDHLNDALSYYGTVQTRIQEATDTASKLEVRQKTSLSDIEDADLVQAALDLLQANTHLSAAMSARALRGNKSLFDYLG